MNMPATELPDEIADGADEDVPNVRELRARFGLSQERFAAMLEVTPQAVRNWEAGHPVRRGPARVLLRIAARNPHLMLEAMAKTALGPAKHLRVT
ncbi:MAG: helix-turn-helix domain-containing protein [Gemmatimonadota bacterium]|jgi:DNA-binding transcriptional regulator YiaG|nr:helix-turn-helix domain-containing protein [Gemmatimonadota bacterium]